MGILLSSGAQAAEPDSVVVRNRLYTDSNRLELQLNYSFGVANTITQTMGPVLTLGYHFHEAWSIDLLVGYMFGGSTDLQSQTQCPGGPPGCSSIWRGVGSKTNGISDFPNIWTMNGLDAQLGVRWEPIYGKLSLFTAVPIHFKWYFGIDVGVAQFSRDSVDYCTSWNTSNPTSPDCNQVKGVYQTLQENRWSVVGSAATGLRFIFARQASVNLGLREYVWGDTYRVHFSGTDFQKNPQGNGIPTQGGITPSLFADLGLSWTF